VNAIHRRSERQRGQALVETALSMLIILLLLAGMVDFGLAFGHRVALANAARGGARYGSRYPTPLYKPLVVNAVVDSLRGTLVLPDDYTVVLDADNNILDADLGLVILITCEPGGTEAACATADRGDRIRVTVNFDYQPVFGGLLGIEQVPIAASTIMNVMGPDQPGG